MEAVCEYLFLGENLEGENYNFSFPDKTCEENS